MKTLKTWIIFIMMGATWGILFWLTGSKTPWMIFTTQDKDSGIVVSLGDMAGRNYDRMGFDGGQILYVKTDGSWLVGTANGELRHISKDGSELWNHSVGSGLIRSIVMSPDQKTVYAGEKSPDGYLYAISVKSGDVLWKYRSYDVIGGEPDIRADPQVIHISIDRNGNIYAAAYRFTVNPNGQRSYISRILSFDKKGKIRWKFPENKNMDAWVNWGDISDHAGRYAFGTANYDKSKIENLEYNKNIYVLDYKDGSLIHEEGIPKAERFLSVTMRNGPSYSPDGKYLVTIVSDGRGMLFDADGHLLWTRTMAKAKEVNGTWFFAAGRDALFSNEGIVFGTINTFSRDNWQTPAPVIHPSSNSLFLFDRDGNYKFKYTAKAEIEEIAPASGIAALAIGRNVRNHNYKAHGAEIINLKDGSELNFYHTQGPLQSIAISDDGRWVAGIEVPAVTPEGSLLGAYRLHLWDRFESSKL